MSITNISLACSDKNRRGGMLKLWITEAQNVTSFTAGSLHDYDSVTLDSTAVKFQLYEFEKLKQANVFGSEGSKENGSDVQTVTGEVFIPKMEATKALSLQAGKTSCDVIAVWQDSNSQYFVAGYDEILGVDAALTMTVTETSGSALTEYNGYTVTFNGVQAELMREFNGDTTDSTKFTQPT